MTPLTRRCAPLLVAALALPGCETPPGAGPGTASSTSVEQACNPLFVGLGAGLACAALASGKNRAKSGAACAAVAVAACWLANSYKAEQVRTARQVEDEYLQRNRQLPERPTVAAYRSQVMPRAAVSPGQEVKLLSTIVVVPGRGAREVAVEEEVGIVDATGESWGKPVRKVANAGRQGGEYQTSFTIPIRDGWSQGVYTVRRALYLDGAVAQRDDATTRFQVVQAEHGLRVVMLDVAPLTPPPASPAALPASP